MSVQEVTVLLFEIGDDKTSNIVDLKLIFRPLQT